MGLPTLTLDPDLGSTWRAVLQENGLDVHYDEIEAARIDIDPKRNLEVPWQVADQLAEIRILEVKFPDGGDRNVYLILFADRTTAERELLSVVQQVLVTSGATVGGPKSHNA